MAARLHHGQLWMLLLLCGCATDEPPGRRSADGPPPTGLDINDAMGASMPMLSEGGYVCTIPTNVQCVPEDRRGRFRCTYAGDGESGRVTIVERNPPDEWGERGQWRWVSGWRRCGILY